MPGNILKWHFLYVMRAYKMVSASSRYIREAEGDQSSEPLGQAALARHGSGHQQTQHPDTSRQTSEAAPGANGWRRPDAVFERRMFSDGQMQMPDGAVVRYWGFADPREPGAPMRLPSPPIRVREGDCVQIKLEMETAAAARRTPSAASLKTTSYMYQWQPKTAGTWLYQSHQGSLREFEMGLFGLLIVDPEPGVDGRARAYRDGPGYDVERCYIFDDIDPQWHGNGHDARKVQDADFDPKYFLVSGVPNVETMDHPEVSIDAKPGDKILIRFLNASFSLIRSSIDGLRADIISVDGKPLKGPDKPWGAWSGVGAGQPVYMATGARHDILIDLSAQRTAVKPGDEFVISTEFLDWSKRAVRNAGCENPLHVGRAQTRIRVL